MQFPNPLKKFGALLLLPLFFACNSSTGPGERIPGTPTRVVGVPGNGQVTVYWVPSEVGFSQNITYTVTAVENKDRQCTVTPATPEEFYCIITGLTNGTAYTFTVTASNTAGTSMTSPPSVPPVTPLSSLKSIPTPPTEVTAKAGFSQAQVSWSYPVSSGGLSITGYKAVEVKDATKYCATDYEMTCVITGLKNGTAYSFTVTATNSLGTSEPSEPTTPVTPGKVVPDAPTNVIGTATVGKIVVSWTAPASDGGSAITKYKATALEDASINCVSTSNTTCEIMGLANGSVYSFTVTATNSTGTSEPSSPSYTVVLPTVPDAPENVRGSAGASQATVSWTAPASNGSAITGYKVITVQDTNKSCASTTLTTCTVTALTNGTTYTFTVKATNALGTSMVSSASLPVTLPTIPGAPVAVSGLAGFAQVKVSWTAPNDGGSVITGYEVTAIEDTAKRCNATSATFCVVTGLVNGTAYSFTVKATNALGTGAASIPSAPVTPAFGTSWTSRNPGTTNDLISLTWTGTQMVSVGRYGTILTSPNGTTWTLRTSGTTSTLNSVTQAGSQLVIVGVGGAIQTSPDGMTWTSRISGITGILNSVTWTGAQLVAVGYDNNAKGVILTSPDGVTWTSRISGTTNVLWSVTWTGTQLMAVGVGGAILTSVDGITWTSRTSGTTGQLNSVTWTGSQFVAVGGNTSGGVGTTTILTSPDGITWTPRSSGSSSPLWSVIWAGNQLVAVGDAGTILTSPDGITWTSRTSGTTSFLNSVIWTGNQLVIAGYGGKILTSP